MDWACSKYPAHIRPFLFPSNSHPWFWSIEITCQGSKRKESRKHSNTRHQVEKEDVTVGCKANIWYHFLAIHKKHKSSLYKEGPSCRQYSCPWSLEKGSPIGLPGGGSVGVGSWREGYEGLWKERGIWQVRWMKVKASTMKAKRGC